MAYGDASLTSMLLTVTGVAEVAYAVPEPFSTIVAVADFMRLPSASEIFKVKVSLDSAAIGEVARMGTRT